MPKKPEQKKWCQKGYEGQKRSDHESGHAYFLSIQYLQALFDGGIVEQSILVALCTIILRKMPFSKPADSQSESLCPSRICGMGHLLPRNPELQKKLWNFGNLRRHYSQASSNNAGLRRAWKGKPCKWKKNQWYEE